MVGYICYQFISYIRSLKIIPPATIFFVWIFIFYTYSGIPISSSYSVSSITVYLVMTWLTISVFSIEGDTEKNLLFVQLRSKTRYIWGKWITSIFFSLFFTIFAIVYPLLLNSFNESITLIHLIISFYSHFILAWFGILIGTFFSITSFVSKKYTWLLASLVIVVSLSYEGLVEDASILKWLLFLLPPVTQVVDYLNNYNVLQIEDNFGLLIVWTISYSLLAGFVLLKLFLRYER